MKKIAVQTLIYSRNLIDRGMDFDRQAEAQQYYAASIFSNSLGYREHSRLKGAWDDAYINGDRTAFQWAYVQFDGVLPIATSGVYFPEFDFQGNRLQALDAPIGALALLGFNILPIGGKSAAIFGWIDEKAQNSVFIKTFHAIPNDHLASAVIQFAFDTSDNLFVKESWWNQLDPSRKSYLEANLGGSTPGEKWRSGLVPKSPPLLEMGVISRW